MSGYLASDPLAETSPSFFAHFHHYMYVHFRNTLGRTRAPLPRLGSAILYAALRGPPALHWLTATQNEAKTHQPHLQPALFHIPMSL